MRLKLKFAKIFITAVAICFITGSVSARVTFLPAAENTGGLRVNLYDSCAEYELSEPLCKGKPCETGWICGTCTNKSGTYYKCEPKEPPLDYTPGLTVCESCHTYSHLGFSGYLINGKCTPIENCNDKADTAEQPTFKYVSGVKTEEDLITDIESIGYRK